MTVAVIADVHGNLPALRAVLAEIDALGVSGILCCGDTVSGPLPVETLDAVSALGSRVRAVRGNADRGAVEAFDGVAGPRTHPDDVWAGGCLSRDHRDVLAGLPLVRSEPVEGLGTVTVCHGTPRRDDEILLETTPAGEVRAMLEGVAAGLVLCGNTHMQFDRRVGPHRVVNPGSVGWPYGGTGAHWALLGPDVEFRRTAYDVDAAVEELRSRSRWPRLETFVVQVLREPVSREAALDFFTRAAQRDTGGAAASHHGEAGPRYGMSR